MIRVAIALTLLLASVQVGFADDFDSAKDSNWHQWRGPTGNGVATKGKPPVTWSETSNVKWKARIPGHGLSTPIIWGDLLFLQTAVAKNGESKSSKEKPGRGRRRSAPTDPYLFNVMALNRNTGKVVWEKTVREEVPHEGNHRDGSLAPSSPITDGKHLFAYFGSRGLYGMTLDGKIIWENDLGDMQTRKGFGEGSSPVVHGNTIVVLWDHEGDSFVVAMDKRTGSELWRNARDEVTSWSTPVIIQDNGKTQVVTSAAKRIRSYDLDSGKLIWECGGLGINCTPTPVVGSDFLVTMSGYREAAGVAIDYRGAKGDLTGSSRVLWTTKKGTSYVPSPLLYGDQLYYMQKNSGILSCVDPRTGTPRYDRTRLDKLDTVYASPVGADGRVYVTARNGNTYVLKNGPTFDVLSINKLDDDFSASPAVVGDALYLRGQKHLYCISEN